ncbi:MAG: peptidylprolyl isomerase [Planctomycetota bacterium]
MTTGQIEAPSSFELWWERKRKAISTATTVVLIAILGWYGWLFYDRIRTDQTWSNFAVKSGMESGYSKPGQMASLLQNPNFARQQNDFLGYYLGSISQELVTRLPEQLELVSDDQLDQAIREAKGTDREPLLLWLSANKAIEARSFDRAEAQLKQLQEKHPHHFLCQQSDYPPQYRRDLKAPPAGAPRETKPHEPEFTEPVKGSMVSLALARIAEDRKFSAEHARFYTAPEPDSQKVALVKTDLGEFKIRFYEGAAKKHVDTFLQLVENHHFDGMAIDQIQRNGENQTNAVEQMHFGLVATKEEQDRTKWDQERNDKKTDVTEVDFEGSGISHFPFMVAAEVGLEGKSLPGRVWINVNDAASQLDGSRVVFGRVVSGEDVVKRLVLDSVFSTEDERKRGTGSPRDTIRIQSITIE